MPTKIRPFYPYLCINFDPNKSFCIQEYLNTCKLLFELLKKDISFKRYYEFKNVNLNKILIGK